MTFAHTSEPARDGSGADVAVEAVNGEFSRAYAGASIADKLDGRWMHGRTFQVSGSGGIEKAFIYLPSQPHVNTPNGLRSVGTEVMKLIAIHEFVHACGLSDADHSKDDLFQASPQVDPGTSAKQDRVRVESGGKMTWMPPFVLSSTTVKTFKSLWM